MKYWKTLEKKEYPYFINQVHEIDFLDFKNRFDNLSSINEMQKQFFQGEIYLIRNAVNTNFIENLKNEMVNLSRLEKSSFHKMVEGCPDFNRFITNSNSKLYAVDSFRHVFYFFRWNNNKYRIFENLDGVWDLTKILNGYERNAFKKNTPKDGIIDRIQVTRYPHKSGYIEPHQHHPGNIRLILNIYLSKKGDDFSSGGIKFYKENEKIELEKTYDINIGDAVIFFSTMKHSVDEVIVESTNNYFNDKSKQGRWWIGLYSPESDMVNNRKTSRPT